MEALPPRIVHVTRYAVCSLFCSGWATWLAGNAMAQVELPHPRPDAPLVQSTSPDLTRPVRAVRVPGGLMMELVEPAGTVRGTPAAATSTAGLPSGFRYVDIRTAEEAARALANPDPRAVYRWVK